MYPGRDGVGDPNHIVGALSHQYCFGPGETCPEVSPGPNSLSNSLVLKFYCCVATVTRSRTYVHVVF